jgi:3-hydroxyisobutyrate dehydrogenase
MAAEQQVGFVGLGAMGSRMAANIQKAGYTLTVYNRDPRRAEPFKERGANVAASPRDVASASDVLFIMVSDPAAVRAVLEGEDGIMAGAREGLIALNCSTIGPADARDVEARANERDVRMIQAMVLGSIQPAEQGELVVLAGGDQALIEALHPLLNTIGKMTHYLGSGEQACAMKLAVNGVLLGSIQLFGEMAALAAGWGIPRDQAAHKAHVRAGRRGTVRAQAGPQGPLAGGRRRLRGRYELTDAGGGAGDLQPRGPRTWR